MTTTTRADEHPRTNSNGKQATTTTNADDSREGDHSGVSHQDTVDQSRRTPTERREGNTNSKNITIQEEDTTARDDDSRTCSEGNTSPWLQSEGRCRGQVLNSKWRCADQLHNTTTRNNESKRQSPQHKRRQPTQDAETRHHKRHAITMVQKTRTC